MLMGFSGQLCGQQLCMTEHARTSGCLCLTICLMMNPTVSFLLTPWREAMFTTSANRTKIYNVQLDSLTQTTVYVDPSDLKGVGSALCRTEVTQLSPWDEQVKLKDRQTDRRVFNLNWDNQFCFLLLFILRVLNRSQHR